MAKKPEKPVEFTYCLNGDLMIQVNDPDVKLIRLPFSGPVRQEFYEDEVSISYGHGWEVNIEKEADDEDSD